MKISILPENFNILNILERAHYEVSGRENIIKFMLINNLSNSDTYKEYWKEYLDYLKVYELCKNDFVTQCIIPVIGVKPTASWEVNFDAKEVTIND